MSYGDLIGIPTRDQTLVQKNLEALSKAREAHDALARAQAAVAEVDAKGVANTLSTRSIVETMTAGEAALVRQAKAQAEREQRMVAALEAMADYNTAEAARQTAREQAQDARDAEVLFWTKASVIVGAAVGTLGIVAGVVVALVS